MQENTNKPTDQLAKSVIQLTEKLLINLYMRWLDEKGYEDFSDYENVMRSKVIKVKDVSFLRGTQRPFGFQFQTSEGTYHFTIKKNGNQLHIELLSIPPLINIKQFLNSSPTENNSSPQLKQKKKR